MIPKGNFANTVSPHAAAAQEAEEEAGVRGAVCPTPLGTYRYRKRKGSGASLMADVEVFPLAVSEELSDWKEKEQRERRWFSPRRCRQRGRRARPARPDPLVQCQPNSTRWRAGQSVLSVVAEKSKVGPMFAWFQRLLPKTGNFFELFEAHAVALIAAPRMPSAAWSRADRRSHENAREIYRART